MLFWAPNSGPDGPLSVCHAFAHPHTTKSSRFEAFSCFYATSTWPHNPGPAEPSFCTFAAGAQTPRRFPFALTEPGICVFFAPLPIPETWLFFWRPLPDTPVAHSVNPARHPCRTFCYPSRPGNPAQQDIAREDWGDQNDSNVGVHRSIQTLISCCVPLVEMHQWYWYSWNCVALVFHTVDIIALCGTAISHNGTKTQC